MSAAQREKPKLDNRIRESIFQTDELADWLRSLLNDLNKGDIDTAKESLREAIRKLT